MTLSKSRSQSRSQSQRGSTNSCLTGSWKLQSDGSAALVLTRNNQSALTNYNVSYRKRIQLDHVILAIKLTI